MTPDARRPCPVCGAADYLGEAHAPACPNARPAGGWRARLAALPSCPLPRWFGWFLLAVSVADAILTLACAALGVLRWPDPGLVITPLAVAFAFWVLRRR